MATAPIDRDTQLALMASAAKRHDELVNRWSMSAAVREIIRKPADHQVKGGYAHSTHELKMCKQA